MTTQTRITSIRHHLSGKPSTPDEVSLHVHQSFPSPNTPQKGTILLLHGFPETSHQFRHVLAPLAAAGYRVIAPDYRGAGHSSRPRSGYDKATLAADLNELLNEHVNPGEAVHVVGHDIGGMVAAAFAMRYPAWTASVAWGECPLPGTEAYDKMVAEDVHGGLWHFVFHWQPDLPEALVDSLDKVRIYIRSFYDRLAHVPTAIAPADVEYYAASFAQPGGMRAGFDLYRAFHQDAVDNRAWVKEKGRSKVPCLMLNGSESFLADIAESQGKEMFEDVTVKTVEGSGHWIAEEKPEGFVEAVLEWVGRHEGRQ